MVSDRVGNEDRRFRAAWLLRRCRVGEMERAACTGKRETLINRGGSTDLSSLEKTANKAPEPLPLRLRHFYWSPTGSFQVGLLNCGPSPDLARCFPLIGIVRNGQKSFQTIFREMCLAMSGCLEAYSQHDSRRLRKHRSYCCRPTQLRDLVATVVITQPDGNLVARPAPEEFKACCRQKLSQSRK